MTIPWDAESTLGEAGRKADDAIDLAETALAFAALERPALDPGPYRDHLEALPQAVRAADAAEPAGAATPRAERLRQVLCGDYGYDGDAETYEDLRNADLMHVIDRRKGLPVSLGILYIHAGLSLGWDIRGLNFPGHFLVRLDAGGERVILDPFHAGAVRSAPELRELLKQSVGPAAELQADHYEPVGHRHILLRLQNNIKLRHLRASRIEAAARVIARMLLLAPDEATLWREKGMIEAHQGHLPAAIAALETYLEKAPADGPRRQTAELLQKLRGQLH